MSLRGKQTKALAALTGFGVLVAVNYYFKPPVTRGIVLGMNRELDQYNALPHPEQDRPYETHHFSNLTSDYGNNS
jgi:hypothetical protein